MAPSETSGAASPSPHPPQSHYQPLPAEADSQPPEPPQRIILPPSYYNNISSFLSRTFRRRLICLITLLLLPLLLGLAIFLLWPSDPVVSVVRLRLERFHVHTFHKISLDLTLYLTVKIRNRDFFSIDYKSLIVAIGYRGKQLGHVTSDHGHIKARGSSYVDFTLRFEGLHISSNVIPLIDDLLKGQIKFDTFTEVGGQLGLIFFEIPVEAKMSCEINVNTHNQTIERHNCYPE